jgi:hypothetical protein
MFVLALFFLTDTFDMFTIRHTFTPPAVP